MAELIAECRTEFIKPGNDGIKNTIAKADEIFDNDGTWALGQEV